VTDTLNYNWDCAYATEFPATVEDIEVQKLRPIAQEAMGLYEGAQLCLEDFLGFEPRVFMSTAKTRSEIQALRRNRNAWEDCAGRAPSLRVKHSHSFVSQVGLLVV